MPYVNKDQQRAYHREWLRKRREAFFAGKSCALCGSSGPLELDHIDASQKVSHRIWSWSEARRSAEIAKCQVLCDDCHLDKTLAERDHRGANNPAATWTDEEVLRVHGLREKGLTYAAIASMLGESRHAVRHAYTRRMAVFASRA